MEQAYEELIGAILSQALCDYMDAKKHNNQRMMCSVKDFFRSSWYELMCDVDGEIVIRLLEEGKVIRKNCRYVRL